MSDQQKTKEQLIEELVELRQSVASLEAFGRFLHSDMCENSIMAFAKMIKL